MVPALPARMPSTSRRAPMAPVLPVSSTNRQTAVDFGSHRSGREGQGCAGPWGGPLIWPGCGCPVVGFDGGHVGEKQEHVGVERFGQEAGGGVFVDDGFDSFELAVVVADDGGAAATGADHDRAGVEQLADETGLHDPMRGR